MTQELTLGSQPVERTESPICTICKRETVWQFSKPLGTVDVCYYACSHCGHLTAAAMNVDPSYDSGRYFSEIDTGWEQRNKRMCEFIHMISRLPGVTISSCAAILDFGCGSGKLVCDLKGLGFNAYGFEPYPETAVSCPEVFVDLQRLREDVKDVELITCIEVIEHLREPDGIVGLFSDLLGASGYLLISTDVYERRIHDESWHYLNPAAGHVSLFTEKSLKMLLLRHSFRPILRINGSVWLFRKAPSRFPIRLIEWLYLVVSQTRVSLRLHAAFLSRLGSLCSSKLWKSSDEVKESFR